MTTHWYTLRSKPHREQTVFDYLSSQQIDAYLPMVKVNPVNPRARKWRPYFPGYMFVHADLDVVGANTLNYAPGVHRLVSFDGEPAVVPPLMIDQLQKRLFEIESAGGLVFDQLEPGDKVKIVRGPFAGFEAIFNAQLSGSERVEVLLAFLSSHPHPVQLNSADIDKI